MAPTPARNGFPRGCPRSRRAFLPTPAAHYAKKASNGFSSLNAANSQPSAMPSFRIPSVAGSTICARRISRTRAILEPDSLVNSPRFNTTLAAFLVSFDRQDIDAAGLLVNAGAFHFAHGQVFVLDDQKQFVGLLGQCA